MNKTKLISVGFLFVLLIAALFSVLSYDPGKNEAQYSALMENANDFMQRQLYQKAIAELKEAGELSNTVELQKKLLQAYEARYQESEEILDEYRSAAEQAVSLYPEQSDFYLILAKNYLRSEDYRHAYKSLRKAEENGVSSSEITAMLEQVKYSFFIDSGDFQNFRSAVNGLYPFEEDGLWGYLSLDGSTDTSPVYKYVSHVSTDGIRIMSTETETCLYDSNGVMQGRLPFLPADSGLYQEEMIAVSDGTAWRYYNLLGDFLFGEYQNASNFQNGKAAVQDRNGEWYLIDVKGNRISQKKIEEIRINPDRSWIKDGVVLLKENSKFGLYDGELNPISDFRCDEVDICTEAGAIAYKNGGQWGFVNKDGTVMAVPSYERAKSYSEGFAAVCVNGLWGFVDENGQIAIDPELLDADYFNDQLACFVKVPEDNVEKWKMLHFRVSFEEQ